MAEKNVKLDWNEYIEKARETVAEGCVLLRNEQEMLPLKEGCRVALFGRMQNNYYKSGVGSGGMVNVDTVIDIPEGMLQSGKLILDEELREVYAKFEMENPYDPGCGWGHEPWSQPEMPITEDMVARAAKNNDVAVVVLARTAGEDRDACEEAGSYLLTEIELDMLKKVRAGFEKLVVLVNSGGIIDFSFVDEMKPEALLLTWQGGMIGGTGIADLLTGIKTPSGKLADTIAYHIEDYPASSSFGSDERNYYVEDIYVGYRYFETFAQEKVRYPFGFGLSYTNFSVRVKEATFDAEALKARLLVQVTNEGKYSGKEVVQLYLSAPQGVLGKPAKVLAAFEKTKLLAPGESEQLEFLVDLKAFASFDDSGLTSHVDCFVLEAGLYAIYVGTDVRSAVAAFDCELTSLVVTESCSGAYAPVRPFKRMRANQVENAKLMLGYEDTPIVPYRYDFYDVPDLMVEGVSAGDKTYTLEDVLENRISIETFVAQLTDHELASLISGEGMGSTLVTPGTAAAFGGVSPELRDRKVPAICCSDGPSGIRMDCGTKAFSLPNGTLLGCTFNTKLVEELFEFTAMELAANHVECLLGPGINIHRHPLNGRNFEYVSEDPLLTGKMAVAQLTSLRKWNVTGVIKHFCGNNQEIGRRMADTVISKRALREIYLKAFEMAVRAGVCDSIMSTYGIVNDIRTSESYDLCTKILREEWGFTGIVMTDWWANISRAELTSSEDGYWLMLNSQNDLFMVTPDGDKNDYLDKTLEMLAEDKIKRGIMQRSAINICRFAMETRAMKRMLGTEIPVVIEGRKEEENQDDITNLVYKDFDLIYEHDLSYKESKKGTNYVIPLNVMHQGFCELTLRGSSELSELAQIPCTIFAAGTPIGTFTFTGTGGKVVAIKSEGLCYKKNVLFRLYVGANGVKLQDITFKYVKGFTGIPV